MPMPSTYRLASKEWSAILADAKDRMNLVSDNSAYTAIDAVLQVFRRRLSAQEGLDFASALPVVPRGIFVKDWQVANDPPPFGSRAALTAEAKAVRPNHNLTPDDAIEAVAWALRRSLDQRDLDRVLARIGPEAAAYWRVEVADPRELDRRIL